MGDFFSTALQFPAVVFTFPLGVVLAYWLFALLFGVGTDVAEAAAGPGAPGGFAGAVAVFGLGGVPAAVPVSLVVAFGWFTAMTGTELLDAGWRRVLVLPAALFAGWAGARLLVLPLRRVFRAEQGIYHEDFVGRVCVVRTGRVTAGFGQAEVAADDGGTSIIQVRAEGPEAAELTSGRRALIFGYDADREFFWVAPYDLGGSDELGPEENRTPA